MAKAREQDARVQEARIILIRAAKLLGLSQDEIRTVFHVRAKTVSDAIRTAASVGEPYRFFAAGPIEVNPNPNPNPNRARR